MRLIHTLLFLATLPYLGVSHVTPRGTAIEHSGAGKIAAIGLEENKGQVRTTSGEAATHVRYRLSQGNTSIFLLESGIAYQFSRLHYPAGYEETAARAGHGAGQTDELESLRKEVRLETFRMDMTLEGADPNARITTEGRSADYTQYYNHDAVDVHTYTKVTYHAVYPGIDWVVYTTEKGMKYDFVVLPGADPNVIRLRFEHHEELALDVEGNLIHGNRMGRYTEERPVSFQDGKEIDTRFVLEGSMLRFSLGNYDRSRTLIIDPARIWGTYYGGSQYDDAWDCATDGDGNVYISGITASTSAIAEGGHQSSFAGGQDAMLVKFNSSGQRLWATYYGGSGTEEGAYCAVDASGNVYLAGTSFSTEGIAADGHQQANGGSQDGFLIKFDPAGIRLWGTYYGGPAGDDAYGCTVDAAGNVYISGRTYSSSGVANGGHQNANNGQPGISDAFLAKFGPDGTRLWGTYYGGEAGSTGYGCAVDAADNVYLMGGTQSTTGISLNGHQNQLGGGFDSFLVKFSGAGTRLWGTYYGGSGTELRGDVVVDGSGNAFVTGHTASTSGIASNGHQNSFGGGAFDSFLVKFSGDGTRIWGTYYGGSGSDQGWGCAVDGEGNAYIAGFTDSPNGIAFAGHQMTYGGIKDAFLVKFDGNGQRQWGTYYGGALLDDAFNCTVDGNNDVYLPGRTLSTSDISADGHQNTIGGGSSDGFLVKFEGSTDGILTGSIIGATFCAGSPISVPFTVNGSINLGNTFTAQLSNGTGSFASPTDIGSLSGTTSGVIDATIPEGTPSGNNYRIRVVASDPSTEGEDNGADIEITTPGSPCDDNDPTTNNDALNEECECIGEPDCVLSNLNESEPNNSAATADPLTLDTKIHGSLGACTPADPSLDYFLVNLPSEGAIRIEACMYSTGPDPVDVTFQLRSVGGANLIEQFTMQAGPIGAPVTSVHVITCRDLVGYQLRIADPGSGFCTEYGVTCSAVPAVFAPDTEPNNVGGAGATAAAHDTYYEGHNGFEGDASSYDYFNFTPPINGLMRIEIQAEHAGTEPGTVYMSLNGDGGEGILGWNVPVGANGIPVVTITDIPCPGVATDYDLRFEDVTCGISYRWKYWMTEPLFADDIEPNNSATTSTPIDLATASYTGQLDFDEQTDDDYFGFSHPGGPFSVTVSAEHAGTEEGTLMMRVVDPGTFHGTFTVPVGGSSTPLTNTFTIPSLPAGNNYDLWFYSGSPCGVSYRIHCATDADFDGVCDVADLCPDGPEPGTSCDDGNAATVEDVITEECECEGELTTGISTSEPVGDELRMWPNPATDEVWIDTGNKTTGAATIILRDLMGRDVIVRSSIPANGQGRYLLPLNELTPGTYLLELRINDMSWSRRIVKV